MLGELDFGERAVMGDATAEELQAIAARVEALGIPCSAA